MRAKSNLHKTTHNAVLKIHSVCVSVEASNVRDSFVH